LSKLATDLFLCLMAVIAVQSNVTVASGDIDAAARDANGRFTNVNGELGHGSIGDSVGFMLQRFVTYFRGSEGAADRIANDGERLREDAGANVPSVTWIGLSTLLIQMGKVSFLTEPIWSDRPSPIPLFGPSRFVKPGVTIYDLPTIDLVVISDNHYDHLDLPSLRAL